MSEWVRAPAGAEGNIWALSPQVGLIPDRKCNSSQKLRQNKIAEFKISLFLTLVASHEKIEWNMSMSQYDLLCLLCHCFAVQLLSVQVFFVSLLLFLAVIGFFISFVWICTIIVLSTFLQWACGLCFSRWWWKAVLRWKEHAEGHDHNLWLMSPHSFGAFTPVRAYTNTLGNLSLTHTHSLCLTHS